MKSWAGGGRGMLSNGVCVSVSPSAVMGPCCPRDGEYLTARGKW